MRTIGTERSKSFAAFAKPNLENLFAVCLRDAGGGGEAADLGEPP